MANKKITDLQTISALAAGVYAPVDDAVQTYKATMTQFQTFITKLTTRGDIMYRGASDNARLAKGTEGQFLRQGADDPAWASFVAPTVQKFLSTGSTTGWEFTITSANATLGATYTNNGNTYTVIATIAGGTTLYCSQSAAPQASGTLTKASGTGDASITFSSRRALGTYTLPSSPRAPKFIRVRMVGPGGGGAGSGTVAGTSAGTGLPTALITTTGAILHAAGGGGGTLAVAGAAGGAATISSPAYGTAITGGRGGTGDFQNTTGPQYAGAYGGGSPFLGGGAAGGAPGGVGGAGVTNTGGGGGGGGTSNTANSYAGAGGAGGAFIDAIIDSPASSYYYIIGTGGTAGGAGTNGFAGGAGGDGYMEIWEHYQ